MDTFADNQTKLLQLEADIKELKAYNETLLTLLRKASETLDQRILYVAADTEKTRNSFKASTAQLEQDLLKLARESFKVMISLDTRVAALEVHLLKSDLLPAASLKE